MLENVKKGDRVKSCLAGWGTVEKADLPCARPVRVRFDCGCTNGFLLDGRSMVDHLHPEIVEVARQGWEPEGGRFIISSDGSICDPINEDMYRSLKHEGRAYPTKDKAKKAYTMIRPFQRFVAYILEHDPDIKKYSWEPEDGIFIVSDLHKAIQHLSYVYIPKEVTKDLAKKINTGEVKL